MSRSGYTDDDSDGRIAVWRGRVASASRGRRGQQFFRDLLGALDAMPDKALIAHELEKDGEVCAIGALGRAKGLDMGLMDPEDPSTIAPAFNIAECLAQEVEYMNDEWGHHAETPEERWTRMRLWVAEQINVTPEECNAVEIDQ